MCIQNIEHHYQLFPYLITSMEKEINVSPGLVHDLHEIE